MTTHSLIFLDHCKIWVYTPVTKHSLVRMSEAPLSTSILRKKSIPFASNMRQFASSYPQNISQFCQHCEIRWWLLWEIFDERKMVFSQTNVAQIQLINSKYQIGPLLLFLVVIIFVGDNLKLLFIFIYSHSST